MSANIFFAPLRTPFVDVRTGIINRQWYLFLQALFNRVGGTVAPDFDDLMQSMNNGVDAATVLAVAQSNDLAAQQAPPDSPLPFPDDLRAELAETRELVAQLLITIQAIQQGAVIQ